MDKMREWGKERIKGCPQISGLSNSVNADVIPDISGKPGKRMWFLCLVGDLLSLNFIFLISKVGSYLHPPHSFVSYYYRVPGWSVGQQSRAGSWKQNLPIATLGGPRFFATSDPELKQAGQPSYMVSGPSAGLASLARASFPLIKKKGGNRLTSSSGRLNSSPARKKLSRIFFSFTQNL